MKIGIEYHRVISYDKLFCSCKYNPRIVCKDKFTSYFPRVQKKYEFLTDKSYCGYEKDQIPGVVNLNLIKKAVSLIGGIPKINILPTILFCRKHIYDGSLVTGFQKTACIAYGGVIELSNKKLVLIDKIYLQQDSSSKNSENKFFVGRQGIPLLQITTVPIELNSKEVVELLLKLDNLLSQYCNLPTSSFCRRQDINISTEGHPRVELKGVDKLSIIPQVLLLEQIRQRQAIEKKELISDTRCVCKDNTTRYLRPISGKSRMYPETEIPIIKTWFLKKKSYLQNLPIQIYSLIKNHFDAKKYSKLNIHWTASDVSILHYLHKKSNPYPIFLKYIKGQLSEYSLKHNLNVICKSKTQLDTLKFQYKSLVEFGKKYKQYFPRGYSLN